VGCFPPFERLQTGEGMLDKRRADNFLKELKTQKLSDTDITWILKQCGVDSVQQLTGQEVERIRVFAESRRQYGNTLAEQWEKFPQ
jgi:hypothetical protein